MHIGLIGGIGPAATVAYYTALVAKFKAAGVPLELTIVHADVGVLIANAGAEAKDAQAEIFAGHLRQLQGAGCDVASITALTGHFCFAETEAISPLPLASAVAPIDQYCATEGISAVGLLGSPAVLGSRLFGQITAAETLVPAGDLDALGAAYLEVATTGICSDATRRMFFEAGRQMVEDQGADAVLLAGTDLGLAFDGRDPGYRVIDALDVHVAALLDMAH